MNPIIDLLKKYEEIPKTRANVNWTGYNLWVGIVHIWSPETGWKSVKDNRQFLKPTSTSPVDNSDETLLIVLPIAWQMIKLKLCKIDRGENTDNL